MSNYIFLTSYTDQGIRAIKLSPKRLDSARTFAANLGGQLKDFYLTFGAYDIVLVAEFPNDTAAAKFVLSVGSLGNVRTTTLKAFSEAEFRDIVGYLTQTTTTQT